ncbi:hypothetical protein [Hyphomicrobium sp. CS1GBMeth3]|uniref:hypothetical protein n=1 Tax=Hyphomicrobium sp. CS1GBMeth3 TaxID=1892845 RepID=UPI000A82606E|nr:hypothetical protein [Hyphomicrobium sp. CS1GBMeth3]
MGVQVFRTAMAVVFLGIFAGSAYAYLDPGTGSMILQVLLGGIAGLLLAGKLYWHKFLSRFGFEKDPDCALAANQQSETRPDAPSRP